MAIADGAAPSWLAEIIDGQLVPDRQTLRQNVIHDIDMAVHELLQGRKVILSARADTVLVRGRDSSDCLR